ncbi:regulatory protein FlaEY [Novosphingobium sp. 11B]
MIGLSVLGGTSAYSSYQSSLASSDSVAVTAAKKAFTTPTTTAPWLDALGTDTATSAQVAAVKRLASIIDANGDSSLEDLPDVQTAFTAYKALENLRILTQAGTSKTISATERAALQKSFAQGLADLQGYLSSADTDLLELGFGSVTSSTRTLGVEARYATGAVAGTGVSTTRAAPVEGLTGSEIFQVTLTRGTTSEVVSVDLSETSTQPPTLDSVAAALNAAIGAKIATNASGTPILDAEGNTTSQWKSHFTVEKTDGKWGLTFNPAGIEKVSIDQVAAGDALMVASGETATISGTKSPTSANVYRIEDLAGSLTWERLSKINAVDTDATARAAASAAATAKSTKTELAENADYTVVSATAANAIATDANGYSYIVGTTAGDMGTQTGDGTDDLFLTKVDSEGTVVWQRNLGAAGTASGAAVTIAPNGEIVVAGTVSGAFNGSDDTQTDLLVSRFNTKGEELSSTAIRQVGNETASAVTVGNDGSIYLAGRASAGGGDAVIVRLDAAGKMQERRTIDSGGSDSISALAIDGDGNLLALTNEKGVATLRKIAAGSLGTDLGSVALGNASAKAIAVSDSGQIAVVGTTSAALNGAQVNGLSGGTDAFVTLIEPDFSATLTSYIGTDSADQADSVAYLNGALYVGGRTAGTLGGTKSGSVDGFVARIDPADGSVQTVSQWGQRSSAVEPVRITAVAGGATGGLGALGLHRGVLNQQSTGDLVAETSLRVGDSFKISVDGETARTVNIEKGETMTSLAAKIRKITGTDATITTPFTDGASSLKIDVKSGHTLELIAGADGKDALGKLGLDPIRLVPSKVLDPKAAKVTPGGRFNLNLSSALTLTDATTAGTALSRVKSALSMIQSAYRSLYWDSGKAAIVDGTISGSGGSAYQQAKLASYQAALSRLSGS